MQPKLWKLSFLQVELIYGIIGFMIERIMNKKNYKTNLKKSFILCGIMFAIILLIFVFATNVNNNVAENMIGRMLYISADNGGTKAYLYDFDNKINTELTQFEGYGDIERLQFMKDDKIVCVCIKENNADIYMALMDGQPTQIFSRSDVSRIIACQSDDNGENVLIAYEDMAGKTGVFSLKIEDETGIVTEYTLEDDKKITGACFSYDNKKIYISTSSEKTVIYSVNVGSNNFTAAYSLENKAKSVIESYKNGIFIQKKQGFSRFITSRERESELEFCDTQYKYNGLCSVTENKFIVGADKNGNLDIYICNGSNMDAVDAVNDETDNIPMDYIQIK